MTSGDFEFLVSSCIRSEPLLQQLASSELLQRHTDPAAGDIALCTLLSLEGPYQAVETAPHGKLQTLEVGMRLVCVLAHRESLTNPTGRVPRGPVSRGDELHLLAIGGLAGIADHVPRAMGGAAARMRVEGFLADPAGGPLNIADWPALRDERSLAGLTWMLISGSSAEIGKTTLAERLIGLATESRQRIFAAKLTGTGRLKDRLRFAAAGAAAAADFVDAGLPSTYLMPEHRLAGMLARISEAARASGASIVLAETGGDALEGGVPVIFDLLAPVHPRAVFLAADAMSAATAVRMLSTKCSVAIATRDKNLRAFERRLQVERVYDVDEPRDNEALWRWLSPEPCGQTVSQSLVLRLRAD